MANQMFTDGEVHNVGGMELEVVSVGYQETDGERHDFTYSFKLKEELDEQRRKDEEARRAAEENTNQENTEG